MGWISLIEPRGEAYLRRSLFKKNDPEHVPDIPTPVREDNRPWEEKKAELLSLMDEMNYEQLMEANSLLMADGLVLCIKRESEAVKQLKVGDWVMGPHIRDVITGSITGRYEARVVEIWGGSVVVMDEDGTCEDFQAASLEKGDERYWSRWNLKLTIPFWIRVIIQKIDGWIYSWRERRKN